MSNSNVREFFDSYAHDFNAIYGNSNSVANAIINRLFRQAMKLRYQKTLEACAPIAGRSVLDIGCGPGHYSVALAKLGAAEVLGIEAIPSQSTLSRFFARCGRGAGEALSGLHRWALEGLPARAEGYTLDLDSFSLLHEDGHQEGEIGRAHV